jgi:peptidoglycan/LPS O-acetylase OafA/YrhL
MPQTNLNKNPYYAFLDGFRAIAIIGVMIAHITHIFETHQFIGPIYSFLNFLGPLGGLGVDVFFVISGFLITGILFKNYDEKINVKRFYVRRIYKILPQYFILIVFSLLISLFLSLKGIFLEPFNIFAYIPYIFSYQNYAAPITMLAHCWSLAIEMQFYLVYPLIIYSIFFVIKNPQSRRKALFFTLFILMIIVVMGRHGKTHMDFLSAWFKSSPHFSTLYRLDGLLCGCLLKILEPYYVQIKKYRHLLAAVCFCFGNYIVYYFSTTLDPNGNIICWDKYFLINLASCLLFLSAYLRFLPFNIIVENPALRWVGTISYSLYLWHYPLIYLFKLGYIILFENHYNLTIYSLWIIGYLLTTVLISALSHFTVEKFFLNLREKAA